MINVLYIVLMVIASIDSIDCYAQTPKNKSAEHKAHRKKKNKHHIKKHQDEPLYIGLINLPSATTPWQTYLSLQDFLADDSIKGLIVKLQGSGDALGSAFTYFNEFRNFSKYKPIVAMVEESCLEGCYYMAAGATKIIASPTATVGLIGAEISIPRYTDVHVRDEQQTAVMNVTLIYKGAFKTMLNPHSSALTAEQKKHAEEIVQDLYDQFSEDIASARNLSLKDQELWAGGKYYSARYALKKGIKLIDQTGSFSDAIDSLKALLKEQGVAIDGKIIFVKPQEDEKNQSDESQK